MATEFANAASNPGLGLPESECTCGGGRIDSGSFWVTDGFGAWLAAFPVRGAVDEDGELDDDDDADQYENGDVIAEIAFCIAER